VTHEENIRSAGALWAVVAVAALIGVVYCLSVLLSAPPAQGPEWNQNPARPFSSEEAQNILNSLKPTSTPSLLSVDQTSSNQTNANQSTPKVTPQKENILNSLKAPASPSSQDDNRQANNAVLDALKAH
jgi:hypothetical protein